MLQYIFELFIDLHVHLIEFGKIPKFFSISLPRTDLVSVPHFLNSFNFPFIFYQFSSNLQQKFLFSSTNSSNMHKRSNELLAKSLKRTENTVSRFNDFSGHSSHSNAWNKFICMRNYTRIFCAEKKNRLR